MRWPPCTPPDRRRRAERKVIHRLLTIDAHGHRRPKSPVILGRQGNVNACQSNILKTSEIPSWCRHNATAYWLSYAEHEVNIESVSNVRAASMVRNEQSPLELSSTQSRPRSKFAFGGVFASQSCVPTRSPRSVLFWFCIPAASVSVPCRSAVASPPVASLLRPVVSQLRGVASRLPNSSSDTPKSGLLASLRTAKQAAVERVLSRARQRLSRLSPSGREPAAVTTDLPRFACGPSSVEGSVAPRLAGAPSRQPRVLN